jgi:hypothetical protein
MSNPTRLINTILLLLLFGQTISAKSATSPVNVTQITGITMGQSI